MVEGDGSIDWECEKKNIIGVGNNARPLDFTRISILPLFRGAMALEFEVGELILAFHGPHIYPAKVRSTA